MQKRKIVDHNKELLELQDRLFEIPVENRKDRKPILQEMFLLFRDLFINKLLSYIHKHKNFTMTDEAIEDMATEMAMKAIDYYRRHPDKKVGYPLTYFHLYAFIAILYKKTNDVLDVALQDYSAEDFLNSEDPTVVKREFY